MVRTTDSRLQIQQAVPHEWPFPDILRDTDTTATDLFPLLFLSQSSVCSKIVQLLGQNEVDYRQKQVVIVSQDSFYRVLTSEQKSKALKGQFNFDHPGEWRTAQRWDEGWIASRQQRTLHGYLFLHGVGVSGLASPLLGWEHYGSVGATCISCKTTSFSLGKQLPLGVLGMRKERW